MKLKIALVPIALAGGFVAYVAMHPGVALAEPRIASFVPTPFAQKASYTIDAMHADVSFEIRHLELSMTRGRFNKFSGKLIEDPSDLTKSSVEFTAQVDSIDTAVPPRDTHLKTADFFDAAKYPTMTFKSTKIEKKGDGYVVTGDLKIKDKTKSISIPFKHYGPKKMTLGEDNTRVGIIAEPITIKRSDFGVGAQFKLPDGTEGASDAVVVRISFEALLDK
ncbi:MAG: polyisoprenoid-binding protein [Chlorobia bacterium]|nr:polyisoprenoid-binding protein [Fimbriimonadaceae bacterium]